MNLLPCARRCLSLTALVLVFALRAQAQQPAKPYVSSLSEVLTIHSKILNEERKVYVHRPKADSASANQRVAVLYVLDADNHFELLSQYADYLSRPDVGAMPRLLVVGIPNTPTSRTRDLTPTSSNTNYEGKADTSAYKGSGGNPAFLRFIQTELIPAIDQTYPTRPYRIFAGHSFGGLAVINCLLTQPDLFEAYIAVSPSLWWDKRYLVTRANQALKSGATLPKRLFLSDGNEGGSDSFFHKDLLSLDSLLAKKQLKQLDYRYRHYPTETHMTEPLVAYFDALRFLFEGWEKNR